MWKQPYTLREGIAIILGLFVTGEILQLTIGPIDWKLFMWPANIIVLAIFVLLLVTVFMFRSRSYFCRFMTTMQAAVPAIAAAALLTIVMGLTRQVAEGHVAQDIFGITSMLTFWPFVLVYVWMTAIVMEVALLQIKHLSRRTFPVALSHIGLFIVLSCGTLGSADMQRVKMYCEQGKPEWRGLDEKNNVHELPLAIELIKFTIDEYPPKLMVIDASGQPVPRKKPDNLLVDSLFQSGDIQGWHVTLLKRIDNAVPAVLAKMAGNMPSEMLGQIRMDSVGVKLNKDGFVATKSPGSACALYVEAKKGEKNIRGWVSSGSYQFAYQGLKLPDGIELVMPPREPSRFASDVLVYTPDGDSSPATIEVNHPFTINGWKVYQLSYNEQMGKWSNLSVFELVRDPWLPIVYIGIFLLALGALGMAFRGAKYTV